MRFPTSPIKYSALFVLTLASSLARAQPAPASATPPEPPATSVAAPAQPGTPPAQASAAQDAPPVVAPAPQGPEVVVAAGKGLTVTSADKRFQIAFRARMQLRETYTHGHGVDTNEVQVRTLRFFTQGYLLRPEFKYLIQLAFGSGDFDKDSSSPIFDAFVEYTKLRDLNVRFGQYFVPFDRARTIREFALQFVDRQIVVRELSLDRDVGIMFSSADVAGLGNRLAYNVFLGGGDGRNRVSDGNNNFGAQKPSVLIVGRVTVRPFGAFDDDQEGDLTRTPTPKLAIGIAGAFNKATSRDHSTYGATYTQGTFDYAHGAADLVFKWHGFSLLAEGLFREANKKQHVGTDAKGAVVVDRSQSAFGYLVQAGQMLTDKLEWTARWDDLHARKGTDEKLVDLVNTRGRQLGTGLNLYLNGHFCKLQADYFYIFGDDIGTATHALRAQLDATF